MKTKFIQKYFLFAAALIISIISISCFQKQEEINVKIKVIDADTKVPQKNDTIEVRMGKFNFPVRKYVFVANYVSDSLGEAKIKLFKNERYTFSVFNPGNTFGSNEFKAGELKENETILIETVSLKKKNLP